MNSVYMMIGIQGSGKTTFANILSNRLNIPVVSSDGIRNEFPLLPESQVFPTVYNRSAEILKSNGSLIFDATNITVGARTHFMDKLKEKGVDMNNIQIIGYYFEPDLEVFKKRVKLRNEIEGERYLPLEVVDDYAQRIVPPTKEEGFYKIIKIKKEENNYKVFEEYNE